MTGRDILAVGGLANGYDLLLLQGEGDPNGGRLVLADEVIDIKAGMHFRAIPGDRTFGRYVGPDVPAAVREAVETAAAEKLTVRGWAADLMRSPLPAARFGLVLVTRYLQRNLFPSIRDALVPGGLALYETFTVHQRAFGVGPTSPDHLLEDGELRARFEGFEIVFYEEAVDREAVARIVARKPWRSHRSG